MAVNTWSFACSLPCSETWFLLGHNCYHGWGLLVCGSRRGVCMCVRERLYVNGLKYVLKYIWYYDSWKCRYVWYESYIHIYIHADCGQIRLFEKRFPSDFKLNLCWSQCGLTPTIISVFHFLLWNASMKRNILGKWIELSSWKVFKWNMGI